MNVKLLAVVTPRSICHGYSTWKTFREEKFTLGDFTPVNMINWGCRNVMKHREIKDSDKSITLDISLKFGSMENMIIIYSYPKDYLVISVKEFIISMGIKTNVRSNKYKKSRYAINNFSMKDLSNIIKEFEKLLYKGYIRKRTNYEPTDIYF